MINVMFSVLGCHLSPDLLVFPAKMLFVELSLLDFRQWGRDPARC
jgi:hypothetical protein